MEAGRGSCAATYLVEDGGTLLMSYGASGVPCKVRAHIIPKTGRGDSSSAFHDQVLAANSVEAVLTRPPAPCRQRDNVSTRIFDLFNSNVDSLLTIFAVEQPSTRRDLTRDSLNEGSTTDFPIVVHVLSSTVSIMFWVANGSIGTVCRGGQPYERRLRGAKREDELVTSIKRVSQTCRT